MLDQLPQALRCEGARVVARLVTGVAEAGKVDSDHAMLTGKQRNELAKRPPGLREPVHEQDGGAVGPGSDVMQFVAVERGGVVGDLRDRGTSGGLGT